MIEYYELNTNTAYMGIVDSIILGIIQGITEFLPISSTGHLILAREYLGIGDQNGLAFDAVLQLATSLAILIYFRGDFIELFKNAINFLQRKQDDYLLLKSIVLGTIPAVIIGLLIESAIENTFRNPILIAVFLIVGSLLFILAEKLSRGDRELTLSRAIIIGFFQVLALLPGMSRSGSTISGGLLVGLKKEQAATFSFLLSFPILFGAGLYKLLDLSQTGSLGAFGGSLLMGSIFSFLTGILAIHYLLAIFKKYGLTVFVVYRIILAVFILVMLV